MDDKSARAFLAFVLTRKLDLTQFEQRDLSIIRSLVDAAGLGAEYDFAYMAKFFELPDMFEDPEGLVTPGAGIGYVIWQLAMFAYSAVYSAELRIKAKPELKAKLDVSVSGILDQCYEVTDALGWREDYIAEYQRSVSSGMVPKLAVDIFLRDLLEGRA